MPELLLSSLSGKDLSTNSKPKPIDGMNVTASKSEGGNKFTNTLSSVVDQSNRESKISTAEGAPSQGLTPEGKPINGPVSGKPSGESSEAIGLDMNGLDIEGLTLRDLSSEEGLKNLASLLEGLSEGISKLDADLDALTELKSFLNGHDFTSQGISEEKLGLSLPEFLQQLQIKMDALNKEISQSESLTPEQISGFELAQAQLNQAITAINVKHEVNKQEGTAPPSLLGFSFNSTNGRGENTAWQRYDPQQMSQNNQAMDVDSLNADINPEQLVSKTDRAFQLQMEQLVPEKFADASEKTDMISSTALETKNKTLNQFSELQLKSTGDGLKQYSTTLSTPVTAQDWSEELNQKVVWFSGRNISAAEMHLNPAELGPIDVKINVQNDVASITFNVNNASVKDLLESSVVRLREMMESSGVDLGEVNIDSNAREQSGQQGSSANENSGFAGSGQEVGELGDELHEQTITVKEENLVDYFV